MIDTLFSNAMSWVYFRLSGGMRSLLTYGILYAVLVGGGVLLTASMQQGQGSQARVCESWAWGLLALQVFGVVSWAPIRVFSAIRHDVTTRRIESHRLMPIGSVPAIIGYLLGQCSHLAAICLVNVLIVLLVGSVGGVSPIWVIMATLAMAGTTLFLCSLFAMLAWIASAGVVYTLTSIAALILMQGASQVVPGALLLISTEPRLLGMQVFAGRPSPDALLPFVVMSMVAQVLFSAVFIRAAARRFTSDRLAVLTPLSSLLVLALWMGVSAAAMLFMGDGILFRSDFATRLDSLIGTTIVGLALTLVLVCSQVRAESDYHARGAIAGPEAVDLRRPINAFWMIAGAVAVLFAIFLVDRADCPSSQAIALLAVSLSAAVCQVYFGAKIIQRLCKGLLLPMSLLVLVIWIGPFVAQLIHVVTSSTIDTPHGDFWLANGSVLRTVVAVCSRVFEHADEVLGGVIFQVVLAVVLGVAASAGPSLLRSRRKNNTP